MTSKTTLFALAFAATATSSAIAQNAYTYFSKGFGNSYAGARLYARVKGQRFTTIRTNDSVRAELDVRARLYFLKHTNDMFKYRIQALNQNRSSTRRYESKYTLGLAGKDIIKKTVSNDLAWIRYSRVLKVFPRDLRLTIPVGPFSVNIKGNAGAGLSTSAGTTVSRAAPFAAISGRGKVWADGKASAAFGIPGARVGVECNARVCNATTAASFSMTQLFRGEVTQSFRALEIKLKSFVKVLWKKFSRTLCSWKSSQYTKVLIRR